MKFGTVEYDLMQKKEPYKRIRVFDKKAKREDRKTKKPAKAEMERKREKPTDKCLYPQPPPNWTKPTKTGSQSYDESVHEINKRLESTLVSRSLNMQFKLTYFYSRFYFNFFLIASSTRSKCSAEKEKKIDSIKLSFFLLCFAYIFF